MPKTTLLYVYVHGCSGLVNVSISTELSKLLEGSKVLRMGFSSIPVPYQSMASTLEMQSRERCLLLYNLERAKETKHCTWIFADYKEGTGENSNIPILDYKFAAHERGIPFFHIMLYCHPEKNRKKTNGVDFKSLDLLRNVHETCSAGLLNGLELDITGMEPSKAAQMIFDYIVKKTAV
ncbi:hypothetical protein ACHAQJ_000173 [Trichoderma viride]